MVYAMWLLWSGLLGFTRRKQPTYHIIRYKSLVWLMLYGVCMYASNKCWKLSQQISAVINWITITLKRTNKFWNKKNQQMKSQSKGFATVSLSPIKPSNINPEPAWQIQVSFQKCGKYKKENHWFWLLLFYFSLYFIQEACFLLLYLLTPTL